MITSEPLRKCATLALCLFLFIIASIVQAQSVTSDDQPCNGELSETDSLYFRATQSGESSNVSVAKKIALFNADTELAQGIYSQIESVMNQYIEEYSTSTVEADTKIQFKEMTTASVKQILYGRQIFCNKLQRVKNQGRFFYRHWIGVEMKVANVLNQLDKDLPGKLKHELHYSAEQFREFMEKTLKKH